MEPNFPNAEPLPAASSWQRLLGHRRPVRNVNVEHEKSLSQTERLALWITQHVGTMGFFFLILGWTTIWLGWNIFAPASLQFDPPTAFVLWLFFSNMIQILLMPLIMVGQNLQGRHSELRADNDYEVNVRAEKEVAALFEQMHRQQVFLQRIAEQLGVDILDLTGAATQATANAPAESHYPPDSDEAEWSV